ncbi:MAG TPA: radical SAM protein, partial [Elusimicrobiales bacterium]|nr:radical SAM protein [Elusimicrobiales bacterium]
TAVKSRFLTGSGMALLYLRISLGVAWRYALQLKRFGWSPLAYARFLVRAGRLLLVFLHNKPVRVFNGWKVDLYLPAYPSPAFFAALESKLLRTPPGPITVVLSITKACSYKCSHCYQRRDEGADLPEDLLLTTARAMQDSGVAMFDIEGGEPLLRLPRLLNLLRSFDGRAELWVNTSGAGLTADALAQLKAAGLFGLMVSIHSPEPALHDAMTGVPGAHEAACNAVRLCREAGLAAAVNSVLSEDELRGGGLARLMDLARALDADFVQLIHPKPAGNWLGRRENMQQDPAVLAFIRRSHAEYNAAPNGYPCLASQVFEEAEDRLGCTAGAVDRFYLNANGEVQPCEFLNISFGNVREEPFGSILERMRSCFPVPCTDWLCCTQSAGIDRLLREHNLSRTPLPWPVTKKLVEKWNRGRPTSLYRSLGIYE